MKSKHQKAIRDILAKYGDAEIEASLDKIRKEISGRREDFHIYANYVKGRSDEIMAFAVPVNKCAKLSTSVSRRE